MDNFEVKTTFIYEDNDTYIKMTGNRDSFYQMFSTFLLFCQKVGYTPQTIHNTINELYEEKLDNDYTAYDWASDYKYGA